MLHLKINIQGKTERDLIQTLKEIQTKLTQGCTMATDQKDDRNYYFRVNKQKK